MVTPAEHLGPADTFTHRSRENKNGPIRGRFHVLAERVGFEPTVPLPVRLISSQVHSTTLPPLRVLAVKTPDYARTCPHVNEKAGEGWGAVAAGAG